MSGVKMKINAKINNNKSSDKKRSLNAFKHVFNSEHLITTTFPLVLIYSTVQMKA